MRKTGLPLILSLISLIAFVVFLQKSQSGLVAPALSGLVTVLLGIGLFYYLFPKPGLFPLLGFHLALGSLVMLLPEMQRMSPLAFFGSIAFCFLPATLFHFTVLSSEIFVEGGRYKNYFIGLYFLSLFLLGPYLFSLRSLPIVWSQITNFLIGISLLVYLFWLGRLIRIIKKPHLELDRVHAASLLKAQVIVWIVPWLILFGIMVAQYPVSISLVSLMFVLFPAALWIGWVPSQRKQRDTYVVQSEKRSTFSNLLSGLSHELNNPMTFIQSNLSPMRESIQSIEQGFPQPDERMRHTFNKLRRMIDHVEEGVRRSRDVVKSFEQFPNQKAESKEEIDLQEILEGCLTMLSPKWKDRLELQKNYGELSHIQGYRNELEQAFTNLLSNAFDATSDQGKVTVTTKKGAGGIKIIIQDTGKGIPPEEMGKIFDPFFTTKEQGKGTGLGLAIALQLITNHKGTIQVKSKPGKGSEFTVFLPS